MKLGAWVVMLSTMIMILLFLGININSNEGDSNPVIESVGIDITNSTVQSADISNSGFWKSLFSEEAVTIAGVAISGGALILLLGAGSVIVGLFAKGYDPSLVILPFVVIIAGIYVSVGWSTIQYVGNFNQWWMTSLITIIFGGLGIGFVFSCVDYFAGR